MACSVFGIARERERGGEALLEKMRNVIIDSGGASCVWPPNVVGVFSVVIPRHKTNYVLTPSPISLGVVLSITLPP